MSVKAQHRQGKTFQVFPEYFSYDYENSTVIARISNVFIDIMALIQSNQTLGTVQYISCSYKTTLDLMSHRCHDTVTFL